MSTAAKTRPTGSPTEDAAGLTGPLSPALVRAMREVPADIFSRADALAQDQDSEGLLAREGRGPTTPLLTVRLLEAARATPTSRALVYGTGTGYATALLARLVHEVCSIEWIPKLVPLPERTLGALGVTNVRLRRGDASAFQDQAPFDLVVIPHAVPEVPEALKRQLAVGGRLVAPVMTRRKRVTLLRITRTSKEQFAAEPLGDLRFSKRLGDLVVESGAADRSHVEQAAAQASTSNQFLGDVLQRVAQVSASDVTRALAMQRGLKFGTIDELAPLLDPQTVRSIPRKFLDHHRVLPVRRSGGVLDLATSEPEVSVDELSDLLRPESLQVWLVTPTDYHRLWNTVELLGANATTAAVVAPDAARRDDLGTTDGHRLEQRFTGLFESMLLDAIGERASDIHLERYGDQVRVRLRIDGDLRDLPRFRLTTGDMSGIVNVIKIRADLDIAEHRLPQGGRFRVTAKGATFDLRVQTQPALHGEHVVIRLLPQNVKILTVEDLGFDAAVAAEYRRLLEQPSGLVLVVGPTGSGKTTTLYAGLQLLAADPSRKVLTVEDPIEYAIDRVQQSAVRSEIGFSFADAMRSFVRQDPDVILVGEIRDHETALEAIRASQTGHLVLSTLHCNDSTDAVQRLIDLGMHPNSIASELLSVISQRLTRRICDGCRREAVPDPALLKRVFPDGVPANFRSWSGGGCARCGGHGGYGRVACVEFLRANAALRNAISLHPPVGELRRLALQADLITMRDSALALVREGKIAFEDLPFLLSWERLAPERK